MTRILCCSLVLVSLLSAENSPAELKAVDAGVKEEGKGAAFWLEVTTTLPEGTCIDMEARLDDTRLSARGSRVYVPKSGRCILSLGPFDRQLLPAEYALSAVVHPEPGRQDRALESYFASWKQPRLEVRKVRYGTEEQEKQARAKEDAAILDLVRRAEALQEEAIQQGDAYRAGRFEAKQFLSWCDSALDRFWALQAEHDQYFHSVVAPYRQRQWMSSLVEVLLSLRLIVIDYLIVPVCRRSQLELPKRAQTVDAMMKPPRDSCIEKNRGLFAEVRRALGAWKSEVAFEAIALPAEKAPSGYGLSRVPEALAGTPMGNPGTAAPPSAEEASALGGWLGAAPIATETRGAYCLFLSEGSPATKWGNPKASLPDLKPFDPHLAVCAFDFSTENALTNFLERTRRMKQDGKREVSLLRKDFLVVVIVRLDDKGTEGFKQLETYYERLLQTTAE